VQGPYKIHPSEQTLTHIPISKYGFVGGQLEQLFTTGGPQIPLVTTLGDAHMH